MYETWRRDVTDGLLVRHIPRRIGLYPPAVPTPVEPPFPSDRELARLLAPHAICACSLCRSEGLGAWA